jgi:mono/diheme cytochrome c family protein
MPLQSRISKSFTGLLHATLAFVFLLSTIAATAQDKALYAKGEKVFKANCASCHKPDKDMTGPALKGAKARWEGKGDIYAWVKNSTAVIKSGNSYANELFAKWNKSVMTANAVTNEDIDAVLNYVDNYKPPVSVVQGPPETPGGRSQSGSWQWLLIVVLLLLVVVLSLANVKHQLKNAVLERDGKEPLPEHSIWGSIRNWVINHRSWASVFGFILFCWLVVQGWNWAINIGIYGGDEVAHYKPEQPIQFNHTLHAGKMAINCQYCHSGVEKSKHAGIPSASVCMNCHKAISEGPVTGTAEIAKIYEAVGWDGKKYTGVEKPITWVKVHNLPDHVAFNHATHVAVGKIECQKCHGPVDTKMDVAEQWSPLTMGWCIQCHNETEVSQMASSAAGSNGYYDEIHRRLTETPMGNRELQKYLEDEKISVKELGGWECAKCHY